MTEEDRKLIGSFEGKLRHFMFLFDELKQENADLKLLLRQKEEEIKNILSQMPSSEEIKQMLSVVGLDIEEFYKFYGEQKIEDAMLYAKDLKDRYTVLWLYYDLFGDRIQ